MLLPFESDAAEELQAAATFYEQERSGYGDRFMSEVHRVVARAARFPDSGAPASKTDPKRNVRKLPLRRFPYLIVTAIVDGRQAVVAVAHMRREPNYWQERLRAR